MKQYKALLLLFTFFFISQHARATHVMGAEVTYEALDTLKYKVTCIFYRSCKGVAFTNPSGVTSVRCLTGSSATVSLTLVGIEEITSLCDTAQRLCSPSNTYNTGDGIEKHTYTTIIDFNSTPYSGLANCSGSIIFQTGQCCRNTSITTGPQNSNFYTYAEIKLNPSVNNSNKNSSPIFTNPPEGYICCNQPVRTSLGAIDTIDYDSLSYSFAHPLSSWSYNVAYTGSFSYNYPLSAYYPGSLGPPYNNPGATPPIGIYLGPTTGELIFTPTGCNQVTTYVIEVKEWRKDTLGSYQHIGTTRREIQTIIRSCPGNNPPTLDGPTSYNVCAGTQLCFNITADDDVYVPPPPAPTPAPDSVELKWNNGIPDGSFTIINPTARIQTGRFCWTPNANHTRNTPYMFSVRATDNHCPRPGFSTQTYKVYVRQAPVVELKDSTSCEPVTLSFPDFTSIWWSNGTQGSSNTITESGEHKVIVSYNNNCFDTASALFTIGPKDTISFDLGDTASCLPITLAVDTDSFTNFRWHDSSTNRSKLFETSGLAWVEGTDSRSCVTRDSINVTIHDIPSLNADSLVEGCGTSANYVLPVPSHLTPTWWTNIQRSNDTIWFDSEGQYAYSVVDTNGCLGYDTIDVVFHPIPSLSHVDSIEDCGSRYGYELVVPSNLTPTWWANINRSNDTIYFDASGTYVYSLMDTTGCVGSDSFIVKLYPATAPTLTRIGDTIFSNKTGDHYWYKNDTLVSSTNNYHVVSGIGRYTATHLDSNNCLSDTSNAIFKTAGVEDLSNLVRVYPNPSSGKLTVNLPSGLEVRDIALYNAVGEKIDILVAQSGKDLAVEWKASNGVMWLMLTTDRGVISKEIVYLK